MSALTQAGMAQGVARQIRFSTHDWTAPAAEIDFREAWADVKTPGDGNTYAVGTIEVHETVPPNFFSGAPVTNPPGLQFNLTGGNKRQIAFLQINDAANAIVLQRYFYGATVGESATPTNGRGIAVWPDEVPAHSRVVICGETFDASIPLSQGGAPPGTGSSVLGATGFIAVYDGTGLLLWTHHVYGADREHDCAVTDVSVRVEYDSQGNPVRDIVTYCGISTFGSPSTGNGSLTPVLPFAAPPTFCSTPSAGGNTDNGPNQWDGFVGRIARDHGNPVPTPVIFHSVVGGVDQDGLFGIAELPGERFAVVGSTAGNGTSPGHRNVATGPSATARSFPFTLGVCQTPPTPKGYCLGTILAFDATAAMTTSGSLALLSADAMGVADATAEPEPLRSTIARDVIAQGVSFLQGSSTSPTLVVVGSTSDPQCVGTFPASGSSLQGSSDGFIMNFVLPPSGPLSSGHSRFHGGTDADGLTGINAWNEFDDHYAVVGFHIAGQTASDIDVATYYLATGLAYNPVPPLGEIRPLTHISVGGGGDDRPTAMGLTEITTSGSVPFLVFQLGNHAGGGIAQDQQARVNIVGQTASSDYPVLGGRARTVLPFGTPLPDAVRTVVDLLPDVVGRTDGTGQTPTTVTFPVPGTNGGTTPPCALQRFGTQLGRTPAGHVLPRMMIDLEWPSHVPGTQVTPGTIANLIVARSPASTGYVAGAIQIGLPGNASNQPVVLDGVEFWTVDPASATVFLIPPGPNQVFRSMDITMPPLGSTFTMQVGFLIPDTIPAGAPDVAGVCPGTATQFACTPALWFSY